MTRSPLFTNRKSFFSAAPGVVDIVRIQAAFIPKMDRLSTFIFFNSGIMRIAPFR